MEVGKKSRSRNEDDRMPGNFIPKGLQTGCLLYNLVWSQRRIPSKRYVRGPACNVVLNVEVYGGASDVTCIARRHLKFPIFCDVFFECYLVIGFFIDNQNIFAFEVYRPVLGSWRKSMTRNILLFFASKSVLASLNRHTKLAICTFNGVRRNS